MAAYDGLDLGAAPDVAVQDLAAELLSILNVDQQPLVGLRGGRSDLNG